MRKYFKQNPRLSEITLHVTFWVIHFVYRLYLTGYFIEYDNSELYTQLILLPIRIAVTYFIIYILIYRYLFEKKIFKFVVVLVITVVGTLLIRRLILYEIIFEYNIYPDYDNVPFWSLPAIAHSSIYIYPVVTLAVIIAMVREWFRKEKLRAETTRQKLEAELKFLKAQIHPHFLFNTINNIYSLALEQSERTPHALLKLSDMLNYMIYESNTERIALRKEIQNLHDYIELEQLRYGDKLDLVFNHKVGNENVSIPPLLLLPFVENAFKHGASESMDKSWIHINLTEAEDKLIFKVENSLDSDPIKSEIEGIGLQNVKKRLNLIFEDKYQLKIHRSAESFLVVLTLDLSNGAK